MGERLKHFELTIDSTGSLAECTLEHPNGNERFIVKGDPTGDHQSTLLTACSCVTGRLQGSPEDSEDIVTGPWTEEAHP